MIEIGNELDGSIEKTISAAEKLNGIPKIVQKFMTVGDFSLGNSQKVNIKDFSLNKKEFEHYISLISTLDEKQCDFVISATNFEKKTDKLKIPGYLKQLSDGDLLPPLLSHGGFLL